MYFDDVKARLREEFSGVLTLYTPFIHPVILSEVSRFNTFAQDPTLELLLASCNDEGLFALERGNGQVVHACYGEERSAGAWNPEHKLSWNEFVEFGKPYRLEVKSKETYLIKPSK